MKWIFKKNVSQFFFSPLLFIISRIPFFFFLFRLIFAFILQHEPMAYIIYMP